MLLHDPSQLTSKPQLKRNVILLPLAKPREDGPGSIQVIWAWGLGSWSESITCVKLLSVVNEANAIVTNFGLDARAGTELELSD